MPLGHMLTLKVAYQVASGLAYLHRKNIIFCDLKSDNILVWSLQVCVCACVCKVRIVNTAPRSRLIISLLFLQVQDVVNIKVSDYGISRQSFHEGALGVEGTPGYQAPEIRPGIVYDEKVPDGCGVGLLLHVA